MKRLTLSDMILFTMLGALLFVSDIVFELIPNVHGVALLICVITLVYRFKALISIFVYVGINAVLSFILASGMTFWWIPYLYIFPILSLLVMLIPKKLSIKTKTVICMVISGLHGLLFGLMYLPFQVIMYNLNFEMALAWLGTGLVFDVIHMVSNIAMCTLVCPLYKTLVKLEEKRIKK